MPEATVELTVKFRWMRLVTALGKAYGATLGRLWPNSALRVAGWLLRRSSVVVGYGSQRKVHHYQTSYQDGQLRAWLFDGEEVLVAELEKR